MQVDNVYFFPVAADDFSISLLNLPEEVPQGALSKYFEVEKLFAGPALAGPPSSSSSSAKAAASNVKDVERLIEKRSGESLLKKQKVTHERVDKWFAEFHKEGLSGSVGLVPAPLAGKYPKNAPNKLDPNVRAYVEHFDSWLKKQ